MFRRILNDNSSRGTMLNKQRPIDNEAIGLGRQIRILSSMQNIAFAHVLANFFDFTLSWLRIALKVKQSFKSRTTSLSLKLDVNMEMTSPSSRTTTLVKNALKLSRHDAAMLLTMHEELNSIMLLKSAKQLFLLVGRVVHSEKPVKNARTAFTLNLFVTRIWLNSGRRNKRNRLRH